ncbi:MAG: 2-hydroxyacyl-CoA dehydratase [Ruminococcaceae bacterium]|nr:2-hydroxyacyl-CoA dehydratase [Oscillospiraceae bacterium]
MALTRKMLKAMGIEDEKIDQIVEAHTETVDALKQQCEDLKDKAANFDSVQKELNELKKTAETGVDWKGKYEKLQAEVESKDRQTAVTSAYKKMLLEIGIPNKLADSIIKGTDLSKIKLDKDGGIEEAKKLADEVKAEWADYIPVKGEKREAPDTPPMQSKTKMSKADIMAIKDTAERQKAIAENSELFGF